MILDNHTNKDRLWKLRIVLEKRGKLRLQVHDLMYLNDNNLVRRQEPCLKSTSPMLQVDYVKT